MANVQISELATTKTAGTIDADAEYLAAEATAGTTYKALIDDVVLAALAQTASTIAIASDVNVDSGTLFVDVSANSVGIGTTSPSQRLEIDSDTGDRATIRARTNQTSDGGVLGGIEFYNDATSGIVASVRAHRQSATYNAYLSFYTRSAGSESERMRINAGGNVGIGITSPSAKLQVAGSIAITDGMTAPSTISGYAVIYVDSSDGDLKVKFGDGTVKTIATDT